MLGSSRECQLGRLDASRSVQLRCESLQKSEENQNETKASEEDDEQCSFINGSSEVVADFC